MITKTTITRLLRRLIEKPSDRHAILTKALKAAYEQGEWHGRAAQIQADKIDDTVRLAIIRQQGYEQGVREGVAEYKRGLKKTRKNTK